MTSPALGRREADVTESPAEILLVEDDLGDVRLTQLAFQEAGVQANITVACDGLGAMACLRREGRYADAPRPDLILLDLNLPKKDGREVLADVRNAPAFDSIPVVVLTASDDSEDIAAAFQRKANCYITKPVDLNEYSYVMKSVEALLRSARESQQSARNTRQAWWNGPVREHPRPSSV